MMKTTLSVAGLIAAVSAFTQPTSQTYGALLTPNTQSSVTTGQDYSVTWDPSKYATDGVTVSLVLCNGPGSNCVLQSSAIVEKVPASAASYTWSVPCSLPAGEANTATGYGMLIIVDGVGVFQYSTQFSVVAGASCSSHSSTTTSGSSSGPSSGPSAGSPSGSPSGPYVTSSGWYSWTSTLNTTTQAYTATSKYTTAPAVATSGSGYTPSGSSPAAASTTAAPSKFTGAAALPTAFANVAGIIGAAGLAMLAL